jgi:hypothetical protein
MKHVKLVGFIVGSVAVIALALGVSSLMRAEHVQTEATAVATELGSQGVTGVGAPNMADGTVPFDVMPRCTVFLSIIHPGADYAGEHLPVTLDLDYYDGAGRFIGQTDTVSNAASTAAVRASLVATIKANPTNGVCK